MEIPLAQYMRWENKLENIVRIKQATKKGFIECVVGGLWICPIQTVKPDEAESRTAEEFAPQLQLKQLGFA